MRRQRLPRRGAHPFRALGDRGELGHALSNLGWLAHDSSDYERAGQLFDESLSLRRAAHDAWGEAGRSSTWAWCTWSAATVRCGRHVRGLRAPLPTSGRPDGLGSGADQSWLGESGDGSVRHGDSPVREALAVCQRLEDARGVANNLSNLGLMAVYGATMLAPPTFHPGALCVWRSRRAAGDRGSARGAGRRRGPRGPRREAARLFGHAEMLRESIGAPLLPADRSRYEVMLRHARGQIDASRHGLRRGRGRMTLDLSTIYTAEIHSSGGFQAARPRATLPARSPQRR